MKKTKNKYKINNKSQKKIRKKSQRKRSLKKKKLKKKKSQVGSSYGIEVIQLSPNTMSEDEDAKRLAARVRLRRAIEAHVEAIRQMKAEKEILNEHLPLIPYLSSSENIYSPYNSNSEEDGVIVKQFL